MLPFFCPDFTHRLSLWLGTVRDAGIPWTCAPMDAFAPIRGPCCPTGARAAPACPTSPPRGASGRGDGATAVPSRVLPPSQLTHTYRHVVHLLLPVPPFLNAGPQRWDALGALLERWKGEGKRIGGVLGGRTWQGAPQAVRDAETIPSGPGTGVSLCY